MQTYSALYSDEIGYINEMKPLGGVLKLHNVGGVLKLHNDGKSKEKMKHLFRIRLCHLCLLFSWGFDRIKMKDLNVSTDNFSTLESLLTKDKHKVATYLKTNFLKFFGSFNEILVTVTAGFFFLFCLTVAES